MDVFRSRCAGEVALAPYCWISPSNAPADHRLCSNANWIEGSIVVARITLGVRAILSLPVIYSFFQGIMGGHQARMRFVEDFVRPYPGMKVLDIGCGPADILAYLPEVDYWGFDISLAYIERARALFGGRRGRFQCKELVVTDIENMPSFDVVFALRLIHHLSDEEAVVTMRLAYKALKPGGRLLT